MAEQKSRIYSLPEITEINDDMYLMLDASDTGARRFNLKTFYDKVDGVQASADAANTAATAAAAAVDSANQAAQQAASAAASATTTVQGLVDDVNEAIEAVGDISEQAVPTMSPTVKGGAKLGTGLEVTDGALSVNTVSSGDGSTAGPILSLSAKGWAEQASTTGKNLCPRFTAGTYDGVTFRVNADGSVTANGTASAVTAISCNMTLAAGTYTLSGCPAGGLGAYQIDDNAAAVDIGSGASFTLSASTNKTIRIRIASGTVCNNLTFYPQLELGSTATSYEPYTGGAPSPSPDYAQEIRVARGRNLLNPSKIVKSGAFAAGGWSTSTPYRSFFMKASAGEVFTLSRTDTSNGEIGILFYSMEPIIDSGANSNYKPLKNSSSQTALSITSTAPSGTKYVWITATSNDTKYEDLPNLQLERGSVATPYVPYGYVGMEAQGKNLLPNNATNRTINGITFARNSDGSITANGTSTAKVEYIITSNNDWTPSRNIAIQPSTQYTLSKGLREFVMMQLFIYDSSGAYINSVTTINTATFTTPANAAYATAIINIGGNQTVDNATFYPQLELGSTATEYQPYFEPTCTPIPLPSRGWAASLSDGTADTLTLDGAGKVTWEQKTFEAYFDGSEEWQNHNPGVNGATSGTSNRYAIYYTTAGLPFVRTTGIPICDRFKKITNDTGWQFGAFNFNTDGWYVFFDRYSVHTLSSFKAWLASNPVTVLYPIATPVTEERGYVENWPTNLPSGCQISIPELDDLNVRYHIDESVMEIARQWYEKARSEYAEELAELRMTVNELATRIN